MTPLLIADGNKIIGMVVLEDILKPGIKERFERLRKMGIRTVMVTGDNPLTAKSIAAQAGVDDFIAAGGDPKKCTFAGVGKSREEIEYALEQRVHSFNVESEAELECIAKIAAATKQAIA